MLLQVVIAGPNGASKKADFAFVKEANGWHLMVTVELASQAVRGARRRIYLDANLALKEEILAKTRPVQSSLGVYRPRDKLLNFLTSL